MTNKMTGPTCDCIAQVNKSLADHNCHIDSERLLNFTTGESNEIVFVPLKRNNSKKRSKLPTLYPKFCCICGEPIHFNTKEAGQ